MTPQPRKHLAKRLWSRDGLTIKCTCGQWQSTTGSQREQDEAHRNHRFVMGETVKPRKPSRIERLEAEIARLLDARDTCRSQTIDEAISALDQVARLAPESQRAPGINFSIGVLLGLKGDAPAAAALASVEG